MFPNCHHNFSRFFFYEIVKSYNDVVSCMGSENPDNNSNIIQIYVVERTDGFTDLPHVTYATLKYSSEQKLRM